MSVDIERLARHFAEFIRGIEVQDGVWVPADAELEVSYHSQGDEDAGPEISMKLSRDGEYVTVKAYGAWELLPR